MTTGLYLMAKLPKISSKTLIWVGGVMIVLGWLLPLLIVLGHLPSTYFLNFISYAFQMIGMILGMLGIFSIVKARRDLQKQKDSPFLEESHPDEYK